MMKTPIIDFVEEYAAKKALRLHMPGHKGEGCMGIEHLDITEIEGADVLYSASGIIRQSEKNASALFGSGTTLYSTEGSSLAIRAMLYIIYMYARAQGRPALIAACRNAHKTFMTACGLIDMDIDWVFPSNSGAVSCEITAETLEEHLSSAKTKPIAVYITSPDYLGNITDIAAISSVCKKYGCLLAVDNAHGAYLRFLPQPQHPINLGADICCDSAHKTLPVLTGGAYLHISPDADPFLSENAQDAMSVFASTSPSYLIMQSLDAANAYLADGYTQKLASFTAAVSELKNSLAEKGYTLVGNEPLKITLAAKAYGYTGVELSRILSVKGLECEFADPDHLVMMLTPEIGEQGIEKIQTALFEITKKEPIAEVPPLITSKKRVMSVRKAMMSLSESLPVAECEGRVLASAAVTCPPAIPIVVCGEELDSNAVDCLKYYGHTYCSVIKGEVDEA